MYKIPEEKWGKFLSQGDTNWCWAYALGGIFGLTKHEEIARLHDTLGMILPDGTINDGASPIQVLTKAKEYGYISDYKSLLYAYKPRRIQEVLTALKEGGIPLFACRKHAGDQTHAIRVIGFDENEEDYLVVDSSLINHSPRTVPYDGCITLFSVEITPENYAKINADFKVDTTDVKPDVEVVEPEKDEVKTEETGVKNMNFIDVKKDDWFHDYVEFCFDRGIINGKAETTFAPNDYLTRAEFCAALTRHIRYTESKEATK